MRRGGHRQSQRLPVLLSEKKGWNINSYIGLGQLFAIIIAGTTFYNQSIFDRQHTDERFALFAEERKAQNEQTNKMQEALTAEMLQITTLGGDMKNLSKGVDEIREAVHKGK